MIVFITIPWFLPAYRAGGPIQSIANLVTHFSEDIEYRIFCRDTDLNGEPLIGIIKNEWTTYNNYTKVWYAGKDNLSNTISKEIEKIQPQVLYIVGLFSWHFNVVPILFCKNARKIISVRGMLHPGALSQKKLKKRLFFTGLKFFGIVRKAVFHATDFVEEQFIKNKFGVDTKVVVAGNFSKKMHEQIPVEKVPNFLTIITVALISPMKNHLVVLQALKNCKAFINYNIYGQIKDEAYWENCLAAIMLLPANIKVQYHGEIEPNLIESVLWQQHIFIMPSKSENFGHAIVEALSACKPVITSNNTPWNNLEINNAGINVDNNVEEITKAISFFAAQDQTSYNQSAKAAGLYASHHVNIAENIKRYKRLFFEKI